MKVAAKRAFQYDELNLDMDQVFVLRGAHNDERLVRLNFCRPVTKGVSIVTCGECGSEFVSDFGLSNHGGKRHSGKRDFAPRIVEDRKGLSPEQINKEMGSTLTQEEAALVGLSAPEDEGGMTRQERQALLDKDRQIRFDKTEASVRAGEGGIELTSPGKRGARAAKE